MTTILGIKTNEGTPTIVMAADRQMNFEDGDEKIKLDTDKLRVFGDYVVSYSGTAITSLDGLFSLLAGKKDISTFLRTNVGRRVKPIPDLTTAVSRKLLARLAGLKIDDGETDFERAIVPYIRGTADSESELERGLGALLKNLAEVDQNPLQEGIRTGYFHPIVFLNRIAKEQYTEYDGTELLVAATKPLLELYHINEFGHVQPVEDDGDLEYFSLGSGSKHVTDYFEKERYKTDILIPESIRESGLSLDNISSPIALLLAVCALKRASKDPYTGASIDLVLVQQDHMINYGLATRERMASAEWDSYFTAVEDQGLTLPERQRHENP
ncbi:hypothetical protein C4573_05310 [Candidatus Woesearchaeota archaeon]|nr:MAG: hypothetical protein C4573_05310 [Candidatus Woesearchaeota archaeon]